MPSVSESTSLGAGFAAGLSCGVFKDTSTIESLVHLKDQINPDKEMEELFEEKYKGWNKYINKLLRD